MIVLFFRYLFLLLVLNLSIYLLWFWITDKPDILISTYIVLLIPFVDFILNNLIKESKSSKEIISKDYLKIKKISKNVIFFLSKYFLEIIKIIFIIAIFYFWNNQLFNILIWLSLFLSIFYKVSQIIYFTIALLLLLFVPLFLIIQKSNIAENISIYVYYFLVIWTVFSIFENVKILDFLKKIKTKFINILKTIFSSIKNDFEFLFYFLFIFLFFILISSFYILSIYNTLLAYTVIFVFFYWIIKFYWFHINLNFSKIRLKEINYSLILLMYSFTLLIIYPILKFNNFDIYWLKYFFPLVLVFFYFYFYSNFSFFINNFLRKNIYFVLSIIFIIISISAKLYYDNYRDKIDEQNRILAQEEAERIKYFWDIEHIKTNFEIVDSVNDWNEGEIENIFTTWTSSLNIENTNSWNISTQENIWNTTIQEEIKYTKEMFSHNLYLWVIWEEKYIKYLQNFLKDKSYYQYDINWIYDNNTINSMKNFLHKECNWSLTTQWFLWPKARVCIESVLVK